MNKENKNVVEIKKIKTINWLYRFWYISGFYLAVGIYWFFGSVMYGFHKMVSVYNSSDLDLALSITLKEVIAAFNRHPIAASFILISTLLAAAVLVYEFAGVCFSTRDAKKHIFFNTFLGTTLLLVKPIYKILKFLVDLLLNLKIPFIPTIMFTILAIFIIWALCQKYQQEPNCKK